MGLPVNKFGSLTNPAPRHGRHMQHATFFALGLLLATTAAHAQSVTVENFIGQVEIVAGAELAVEAGGVAVEREGDALRVDGGVVKRDRLYATCNMKGQQVRINRRPLDSYPTLRITAPATTALVVRDSIVFSAGTAAPLGEVDVSLANCGGLSFGDVSGTLRATINGLADVSAGDVGAAELRTSGSGDFEIGDAGSLSFRSSGSGDLASGRVAGPAAIQTSGAGDAVLVAVGDGLEFRSSGSGDLLAGRVDGAVSLRSTGSGDVEIDAGEITALDASSTGSGDVKIGGRVGDAEIRSTGSGDVDIAEQAGRLSVRTTGSGTVRVNDVKHGG